MALNTIEALYQCFSSQVTFPKPDEIPSFEAAMRKWWIAETMQGHAKWYRITLDGYLVAMDRWGHKQR